MPRACETVRVISRHADLAPIGKEVWLTPDEAKFMVLIGRAQYYATSEPDRAAPLRRYKHREMRARK